MIFDKINIAKELKKNHFPSAKLTEEIVHLLNQSASADSEILNRLSASDAPSNASIKVPESETENIFTFQEIENVCINYRLRFLDTKYFKQEFPYDAFIKIKEFEKRYNTKIKNFKIIAPDKVFDLQDVNQDPLLFAQISENKFYLIHHWGNDLAWYRKFLYFPIRDIYTYFYSIIILAAVFAFSIPFKWLQVKPDNEIYIRVWFTVHCTIGFFFFILFIGAVSQASFSSMSWKSKYFNE